MFFNRLLLIISLIVASFLPALSNARATFDDSAIFSVKNDRNLYDSYPWMFTYYYGFTSAEALLPILRGNVTRWPEHIQSFELAKTLSEENEFRRFFSPLVSVVQIAGDFTFRKGIREKTIYEIDPYIAFRWTEFPWNNEVVTSLAIGEGISYATSVPFVEAKDHPEITKRFLNYLMLEATFALPENPRLQLVARIHHRSGAYGLYRAGNSGSNVIGLGIRYLFD